MLYRYRPAQRAESELREAVLWFSNWSQLNDPFEFAPALSFRPEDHVGPRDKTNSEAYELALMFAAVHVPEHHMNAYRAFTQNLGVCCFSKNPLNLLMWSHYADSHRGMGLGFDGDHTFFEEKELPADAIPNRRDIAYVDARQKVELRDLRTAESIAQVTFTKPRAWAYEEEVRLVHQIYPGKQTLKFPLDALREVIVGHRSQKAAVLRLREDLASQAPHVKWRLAYLDPERLGVTLMPLPIYKDLGGGSEMILPGAD